MDGSWQTAFREVIGTLSHRAGEVVSDVAGALCAGRDGRAPRPHGAHLERARDRPPPLDRTRSRARGDAPSGGHGAYGRVGVEQGTIAEITGTAVVLEVPGRRTLVPAKEFSEHVSVLVTEGGASA